MHGNIFGLHGLKWPRELEMGHQLGPWGMWGSPCRCSVHLMVSGVDLKCQVTHHMGVAWEAYAATRQFLGYMG
jgi:hypothetical protein